MTFNVERAIIHVYCSQYQLTLQSTGDNNSEIHLNNILFPRMHMCSSDKITPYIQSIA